MSFNLYGLIVGLSIVLSWQLIIFRARKNNINISNLEKNLIVALLFGILGARVWHVATDFYLYQNNLWDVLKIWNGGLSILGGIFGGVSGFYFSNKKDFKTNLDLIVFGLPLGQAVGRLGNFVNQELYGLPTNLPWGINIDHNNRLFGFENIDRYHPLFAYESLLMIIFGLFVWRLGNRNRALGSGKLFKSYIIYYLIIRFLLDFLRIESKNIFLSLGINQIIILLFILVWILIIMINKKKICH
jgi:prolipoprotein diacylglyceryl transferase